MRPSVRAATRDDLLVVFDFIQQLAAYEKMTDEIVSEVADLEAHLFPATGAPAAHCLLAFADDEPVGFALFFYNYSTFVGRRGLYLEDLFVRPEARGQGHGKALLTALAQRAHAEDCGRMEWSVLDWNEPAIRFYRGLGARLLDEWRICRLDRDGISRVAAAPPA